MIVERPRPSLVQPLGEIRLSRRLTVVRDDPRWWFTYRVVQWIAALMVLIVLAALLSGCGHPPSRGEECARYCHPLALQGIESGAYWGACICGPGPVCADGRRP